MASKEFKLVKRRKEEEIAGVVEFDGIASEDPVFLEWSADHKANSGGKIKISRGIKGVRVAFTKSADMVVWQTRFERLRKQKVAS